ncbi:hypothetical protein [Kineosporia babensis]|uniref:Uncharacterized protein n=1 Tax=Kineosporia babensis TaxID=499548 RepID=A0A9X1NM38_9ACTN|nr:hypothetical protein [Kineosporia babensis]MCD5316610.1 hypothetical protein [Kineosporia babensis]
MDVDLASNILGGAWTFVGLVAKLPLEVVLAGTAITQYLAVGQSILAKSEDHEERQRERKEKEG